MPQMSPLFWLNLLVMFLIVMVLFLSSIYFINLFGMPSKPAPPKKLKQKIWKW